VAVEEEEKKWKQSVTGASGNSRNKSVQQMHSATDSSLFKMPSRSCTDVEKTNGREFRRKTFKVQLIQHYP